ncbi:histone acetyl transferase-6 [Diaporthe helianthi]|uniref:Histone acetyltransferase n=1 Tax=Diaporthe helianthi TaxID=158607 RepID=A0A2P5I7E1_DIAHE|nr:histone acetyl transferase-6 [Diaporthe helianthi]
MAAVGSTHSAHLSEDELQQSATNTDEAPEFDQDDDAPGEEDPDAEGEEYDEEVEGDEDAEVDEDAQGEYEDLDVLPEETEEDDQEGAIGSGDGDLGSDADAEGEDDDNYDDDAEGEPDDEDMEQAHMGRGKEVPGDEEEEENEDEEGVGAVKLRPGETDDEDSEASAGESYHAESEEASEEEAEWNVAADNNDDDDDDESENAPANICIFCKQDEENDPCEEFEIFLTCTGCGDSAHQQCARENKALEGKQTSKSWRCPECHERSEAEQDESQGESQGESQEGMHDELNGIVDADSPPATRRATAPKLARDLLPSQRGAVKPDSHSMFNQLVLDDDPMDGSRVLRKRKTSSAEADEDIVGLRKRRKNTGDSQSLEGVANGANGANVVEEEGRPRSARSLRLKISTQAPATIIKKTRTTLVLKFRVAPTELKKITSKKPKPSRSGGGGRRTTASRPARALASSRSRRAATPLVAPFASNLSQPFYSFFDKDMDDKGKPYGGILTEAEADTSKTVPTNEDRRRFDEAKQKAEEDWQERLLKMQEKIEVPAKKSKKSQGPASQIECIEFGGWEIDTWYAAPYPEEYSRNRVLFICEFCLKYMNSDYVAWRHKLKCPAKHPPGDEIYRHGSISVFEVDGRKNPVYCQNLCLLAKLFLGSKTLYYDVEPFLFYVLCEYDDLGYHFVGYFSKEKRASSQNNVSCILTLPIHQRKGYGNLLIDFSYLLTRVEGKTGSPEKPLSDMGLVSYRNYWRLIMCRYLLQQCPEDKHVKRGLSIKQISDETGLTPDDVISALEGLRCLVREPQTQLYAFRVDIQFCKEYVAKWESKNYVQLDPSMLTWTPYVMGRSNATNFELAPAIHAIAPRDEDDEQKAEEAVVAEVVENGRPVAVQVKPEVEADIPPEVNAEIEVGPVANGSSDNAEAAEKEAQAARKAADTPIKSTEPNEMGTDGTSEIGNGNEPVTNTTEDGFEKRVTEPEVVGSTDDQKDSSAKHSENKENSWLDAYSGIPPARFVVYPHIHGGRRTTAVRPITTPRPPAVRTASVSRPKARRPTGSRRSAGPKARSSSSGARRKPGGTGRGPGRWPKGTKKSDYGNADSGPGLPPGWLEQRRLELAAGGKITTQEVEESLGISSDVVQGKLAESRATASPRCVNGNGAASSRSSSSSSRKTNDGGDGDGDVAMADSEGMAV